MPDPSAFLKGFGIFKDMKIGNYTLSKIEIHHNQIVRYHQYEYPITLTFTGSGSPYTLLSDLSKKVAGDRIINSHYGNPYSCNFGTLKILHSSDNTVVITTTGKSVRV